MEKHNKTAILASCLLIGLCFASIAEAAEETVPDETVLKEVVVTDSKINQSKVTVITEVEIKAKGAANAAEALKDLAGFYVTGSNTKGKGYGQFRGSDANSTKVIVDGVLLSTVGDGRTDLRAIPAEMIEKIEVIKGSAPVLYGTNAPGGVIYITTKNGSKKTFASLTMAHGSWGSENYSASLGGSAGKMNYYFGIRKENSGGYTAHSEKTAEYFNGKLRWDFNPQAALTILGSSSESKEQIPNRIDPATGKIIVNPGRGGALSQKNSYFTGTYNWAYDPSKQSYLAAVYNQNLNKNSNLNLKVYQSNQKSSLTTSGYQTLDWDGKVKGYELQHTLKTSRTNTLTSGYSYEERNFVELTKNMDGTSNRADYNSSGHSYYLQDILQVNSRLDLSLGYRHNKDKDYISPMPWQSTYKEAHAGTYTSDNYVTSLNYKVSKNTAFHGSIGTSYRFPNVMERSAPGGIYNGVPCEYLLPEEAVNRELGLSHSTNFGLRADITYFNKDISNMIKSTGQGQGRNQYFNIPDVEMHGYEIEIKQKFSEQLTGFYNTSYTNAYDPLIKDQVRDIPYRKYSYGLNYAGKEGINANLAVNYMGERKSSYNNGNGNGNSDGLHLGGGNQPPTNLGVTLPGYHIVDLKVGKVTKNNEYYVKITNLLDQKYYLGVGLLGPGKYVEYGITTKF